MARWGDSHTLAVPSRRSSRTVDRGPAPQTASSSSSKVCLPYRDRPSIHNRRRYSKQFSMVNVTDWATISEPRGVVWTTADPSPAGRSDDLPGHQAGLRRWARHPRERGRVRL